MLKTERDTYLIQNHITLPEFQDLGKIATELSIRLPFRWRCCHSYTYSFSCQIWKENRVDFSFQEFFFFMKRVFCKRVCICLARSRFSMSNYWMKKQTIKLITLITGNINIPPPLQKRNPLTKMGL